MSKKIILILGVLLLFSLALASAADMTYQYGMMGSDGQFYPSATEMNGEMINMMQTMMSGYSGYYNQGTIFLSWITYLVIIALMIAGIYWLIKTANRRSKNL